MTRDGSGRLTAGHSHARPHARPPVVLFPGRGSASGDYDLTSFGLWYMMFYPTSTYHRPIHKLKAIPARRWVAAHNHGIYEFNPARLGSVRKDHYERKKAAGLDRPKTPREICSAWLIYGRPGEGDVRIQRKGSIGKHLDYLRQRAAVLKTAAGGRSNPRFDLLNLSYCKKTQPKKIRRRTFLRISFVFSRKISRGNWPMSQAFWQRPISARDNHPTAGTSVINLIVDDPKAPKALVPTRD